MFIEENSLALYQNKEKFLTIYIMSKMKRSDMEIMNTLQTHDRYKK